MPSLTYTFVSRCAGGGHTTLGVQLNGGATHEVVYATDEVRAPLSELAHRFMTRVKDSRDVIADPHALYFGGELTDETLVPAGQAWQGALDFDRWFAQSDYGQKPSANA